MSEIQGVEQGRRAKASGRVLPGLRGPASLRGRIFWSVIPITLVLWVVVSVLSMREHQRFLENEFLKRGEAMAANLAYSSELGVFAEDRQLLEASMRGVLRSPDFAYALIYGEEGGVLISTGDRPEALKLERTALRADEHARLYQDHESFATEVETAGERVVEFVTPILSQEVRAADEFLIGPLASDSRMQAIGAVRLGLSLRNLEAHAASLMQLWAGVTVLLIALGTVVVYILARRITRPVNRLTDQAKRIAEGVLDQVIPVESRDEIGQLAVSFNQMAKSLKRNISEKEQAFEKIQELNRTLEERIHQRTKELEERTAELEERSLALQQSLTEVRAMGEISRAVSSTLDLRQVLNTIARYAVTLSKSDGCAIFQFNPARGGVDVVASHNLRQRFVDEIQAVRLEPEQAVIAKAFQIPDIAGAEQFQFRGPSLADGYRSALVVPMGGENATRGAALFRRTAGRFSYRVVDLLMTLANQSKVAIDNAHLFAEVQRREIELEKASKHKSQFLANMSHELRTPLNAILGYTELIQDGLYGSVPDKVGDALARIDHNGRHLLGLINDVLDLSKIEAGQLALALDDYSIIEAVRAVVASVEALASEKHIDLKIKTPDELPIARGDERRIRQVLLNLIANAIKFTDEGRVAVEIARKNGAFLVSVSDTGPGISAEEQQRIFEEFHQADNSSTREKGGSGLGLSIAKRIIDLHGGRIWVDSRPGEGSVFWVELPIRVEEGRP